MNDPNNQTGSLNVQADATTIYEGGNLLPINIKDLTGNEVALRQLVNTLNLAHKENSSARLKIASLELEVASFTLRPLVVAILGFTSIAGAVLIGFGTNYLSASAPPAHSGWILTFGVALTVVSAAIPPFIPFIVKKTRSS